MQQSRVRADGVRITHDPFAPGMLEKYGAPGETDDDGFDPYRDTVGAGIYGGIVRRSENGSIVIGKQYQGHNSRPGPVYAGGGYTPMSKALRMDAKTSHSLNSLLEKFPELANTVSTGGATPLHMCGMSRKNQMATSKIICAGGDIESLDTYGFTPLHRMASNNLAIGAQTLLDAGADPCFTGKTGQTPMDIALESAANDVIDVLRRHGEKRKNVPIERIEIFGGSEVGVRGLYIARDPKVVPDGFAKVCREEGWNPISTWARLGHGVWFEKKNLDGAYVYFNRLDRHWWIDNSDGKGVYKAAGPSHAPPGSSLAWKCLTTCSNGIPPTVLTFRALKRLTRVA